MPTTSFNPATNYAPITRSEIQLLHVFIPTAAVALNEGLRRKRRLWRTGRPQLEAFAVAPGPVDAGGICWSYWID